jgi:hypothetical protein
MDWIHLAVDRKKWWAFVRTIRNGTLSRKDAENFSTV